MSRAVSVPILVALFVGAGVFNAVGSRATRDRFRRWGYPAWWCRLTGASELVTAGLIAFPATRGPGLILGLAIVAAAFLTVLRHRDYAHVPSLGLYLALLVLAKA